MEGRFENLRLSFYTSVVCLAVTDGESTITADQFNVAGMFAFADDSNESHNPKTGEKSLSDQKIGR